ncbi:MAG: amino acid permease-associated protein [Firmicutes bacterium HGW-Firmicutes-7]|nr:MAG: amino acid permease-associated protein [Firmicutes bacterium HGW-Firmicutes-7]
MKKQLNTWTLSGLMIGPILGSGIIFLPPLAFNALGHYAIWAWVIIMIIGSIFAYIFVKMTLLTTSNEGMSLVIGQVLGDRFRELASNYLTAAVCFGPIAVILTAASFLKGFLAPWIANELIIAFVLLLLCALIIAMGISSVGRLVLILSTVTALLLVSGGIGILTSVDHIQLPVGRPPLRELGYTLLLVFWSIIGWEIIGNYIEDVKNPTKTILRAMKVSLVAIILVYLVTTFALQNYYLDASADIQLQVLLVPFFGSWSNIIFSVLAACLCVCTILMFVGAVERQMTSRAKIGQLPQFFTKPHASLVTLTLVHILILGCVAMSWINLEWIVGIANMFFISNALLGLFASFRYMKSILMKGVIVLLMLMLGSLLFFSSVISWIFLVIVTGLSSIGYQYSKVPVFEAK